MRLLRAGSGAVALVSVLCNGVLCSVVWTCGRVVHASAARICPMRGAWVACDCASYKPLTCE